MPEKEKIAVLRNEMVEGEAGATNYYRCAKIKANGALVVGGRDSGAAPEGMLGGDCESWVEIEASAKDDVLLALLELAFTGKYSPEDSLADLLKQKNIPYNLRNEVW
jgi:hypothetical protein